MGGDLVRDDVPVRGRAARDKGRAAVQLVSLTRLKGGFEGASGVRGRLSGRSLGTQGGALRTADVAVCIQYCRKLCVEHSRP